MKRALLSLVAALWLGSGLVAHAQAPSALPLPTSLRDAERELADLDRKLTEVEARTTRLSTAIATREHRSLARSRAYARLARAGLLPLAGGFDVFVNHAMKLESARRAILLDLDGLRDLRRDAIDLASVRSTLAARRALVVAQRDGLGQAQALVDEAEERRRAFERAFSSRGPSTDHAAVYGASVTVVEPAAEGGFEAARGRLPMPLAGRTEIRSVRRSSGPALELLTAAGSPVRVVHPGRVAFTGQYTDYGRLVIVDHGSGYFTVYGNLNAIDVRVGDELSGGARLGAVADQGKESALLFEVRQRNSTIDPRPWLGL